MQKEDKRERKPRMEFVFTKFPGKRTAAEVTFTDEEMGGLRC